VVPVKYEPEAYPDYVGKRIGGFYQKDSARERRSLRLGGAREGRRKRRLRLRFVAPRRHRVRRSRVHACLQQAAVARPPVRRYLFGSPGKCRGFCAYLLGVKLNSSLTSCLT